MPKFLSSPNTKNSKQKWPITDWTTEQLHHWQANGKSSPCSKEIQTVYGVTSFKTLICKLSLAAKDEGRNYWKKSDMEDALNDWFEDERLQGLADIAKRISFVSDNDSVARFVALVADPAEGDLKLHEAAMKHFIWQVKTKLSWALNGTIDLIPYPMMPVITGQSRSGKSHFVQARFLGKTVPELVTSQTMRVFTDYFGGQIFEDFFIIMLDEMAKFDRTDAESFKNRFSEKYVEGRGLFVHGNHKCRHNATFIATSNLDVQDIVKDAASANRTWQITVLKKRDLEKNFPALDALNYLEMWQSVDEKQPSPFKAMREQIEIVQHEKLRPRDAVERWAETFLVKVPNGFTKNDDLYKAYQEWYVGASLQKGTVVFRDVFCKKLSNMGYEACKEGGARGHRVKVKQLEDEDEMAERPVKSSNSPF